MSILLGICITVAWVAFAIWGIIKMPFRFIVVCSGVFVLLCTCQRQPRAGGNHILNADWFEMLKSKGAKQLPNGWLDTGNENLKSESVPGGEWLYIDHAKTGVADMRIHYYAKWRFLWYYYPAKYGHADYEILLNGKWIPVKTEGRDNTVIAHDFIAGKWQ